MLPTTTTGKRPSPSRPVLWHYFFRRLVKPKQMDFQVTFWTMLQLLVSPKTAYRQTGYHKQTKHFWARDDPAFVVVSAAVVAVVVLIYGLIFGSSAAQITRRVLSSVAIDYLLLGCIVSTATWFAANRLLQRWAPHPHSSGADQSVEWGYAFDVHCNAFWPLFLLLGVLQLLLCPVLLLDAWFASRLSACLYAAALCYYLYLVFLGYSALPFLSKPEAIMYPCALVLIGLVVALAVGFNPTKFALQMYWAYE